MRENLIKILIENLTKHKIILNVNLDHILLNCYHLRIFTLLQTGKFPPNSVVCHIVSFYQLFASHLVPWVKFHRETLNANRNNF